MQVAVRRCGAGGSFTPRVLSLRMSACWLWNKWGGGPPPGWQQLHLGSVSFCPPPGLLCNGLASWAAPHPCPFRDHLGPVQARGRPLV